MVTCPPLLVAPPPTEPYVGGLFAAARFPELPAEGNGNRWECGIQYEAESCAKPSGWHETCPPDAPPPAKVPTLTFPLIEGTPFITLLGVECKPIGNSIEELERRVVKAFTLCEQAAVEDIWWTGSEGNNSLAGTLAAPSDCPVLAGSVDEPLSPTAGIAALESYLRANYCGTGVIHAPVAVAAFAAAAHQIYGEPRKPTTVLGTRFAFGGGYTANTGPDGVEAPDGVAWLYATGAVNIWRSEVWVNPDDLRYALNLGNNDATVFAERKYIVTSECVCAAVPVSLSCNC